MKHRFTAQGTEFCVEQRYQLVRVVGSGTYGVVVAAWDTLTMRYVAIKKILRAFQEDGSTKSTLRELRLMHYLRHENILTLLDIDEPDTDQSSDCTHDGDSAARDDGTDAIYVVMELMDTSLRRVIRSDETLSDSHVQFFIYQLVRALKYIHSAHVIHRDVKPGNILVNKNCDLKLCDFGMARFYDPAEATENLFLTEYVVSRWYRAPEILLSCDVYDAKVDIWAVGCILAELFLRRALFQGSSTPDQLVKILRVLGTPSPTELAFVTRPSSLKFIKKLRYMPGVALADLFSDDVNPLAIDLMEKLLVFDPRERWSAPQILEHPYLAEYHLQIEEPEASVEDKLEIAAQDDELDQKALRALIWKEIAKFHPKPSPAVVPPASMELEETISQKTVLEVQHTPLTPPNRQADVL
mmetsp:Transcript_4081/g.7171  ORF Transcript_4081/g.7171 Transcript_4081/m.7171 type:complete len:412 (-) Transcript_4081:186-1421(-)